MNLQSAQPHQGTLMAMEIEPSETITELPPDFKANGYWQILGQKRAGTLRRKGLETPTAYFIVSHQANQPPFNEPTEVRFEARGGLIVIGQVMESLLSKDAGGQGECSEHELHGERCQKARFWITYCKDHTRAKGYEVTDDGRICMGQKKNGGACNNKAKVGSYCAQHGGGTAPREKRTRLYEFPISIEKITGGQIQS